MLSLTPHWLGGDLLPETFDLSTELRRRLRAWNRTWETVLDPVSEIRWPAREVGIAWAAEGTSLVRELQTQLGPTYRVVSGFDAYDPESPLYEGK